MEKEKFSQIEVPFRKEISDRFLNLLLPNLGPREFYHGDMVAPIQLKEEGKKKNLLEKERGEREGGILANNGFSEKKKKRAANIWCHETGAPEFTLSNAPKAAVFYKKQLLSIK